MWPGSSSWQGPKEYPLDGEEYRQAGVRATKDPRTGRGNPTRNKYGQMAKEGHPLQPPLGKLSLQLVQSCSCRMLRTLKAQLPCPSQELITYSEMSLAEKQPEPPAALHLPLGSQPLHPVEVGGHGHPLAPGAPVSFITLRKKRTRSPARQGYRPEALETGGLRCWGQNLDLTPTSQLLGTLGRGNKLGREGPSPQLSPVKAVSHSRASERMDEHLSSGPAQNHHHCSMGERTSDCPQSTQVFSHDCEQNQSENPAENVVPRLGRGLSPA